MQEWFQDAKFGIFITWGIYSLGKTSESWDMFNGVVSREDYVAQAAEFTASEYDPEAWAELFQDSGARYAVLVAKHHDGFALWDTKVSSWNAVEAAPAGRDLVGPYVEALRARKLKVGIYFSHSDWLHPDYATMTPRGKQAPVHDKFRRIAFAYPQHGDDPEAWQRYLEFHRAQLKELCTRYSPDLLWFDGDWERDSEQWDFKRLRDELQAWAPGVIANGRMGDCGDYASPEQALPVLQPTGPWEFCVTMNDNWGYRATDQNFKTPEQCLDLLIETVAHGGNLLLDIGPTETGEIKPVYADTLRYIGAWLKAGREEAIFGTRAGLPFGHFWGPTTRSTDGRTLYLFVYGSQQEVSVKGLISKVRRVTVLGHDEQPLDFAAKGGAWWVPLPGFLWVQIKPELMHPHVSVLKLEFDEPVQLYRGLGDQIRHNV